MAISLTKISKNITLDLKDVPPSQRATVKREVGEFVVEEILRSVSAGDSPVAGRNKFKRLNRDYADAEKGGNTTPNLELDGDMLDSLTFKNSTKGVQVGIFAASEVPKADGHNNFSGKSKLPTRRFVPDKSEKFDADIERGITAIVNEFRVRPTRTATRIGTTVQAAEVTAITLGDLFSDEGLESFLESEGFI